MEISRNHPEKPSLSLHRTKILLEFLASNYVSAEEAAQSEVTGENFVPRENLIASENRRKAIAAYLVQVHGFVKIACQYITYNGLDIPEELQNFIDEWKNLNDFSSRLEQAQVEQAKRIIGLTLSEIKNLCG